MEQFVTFISEDKEFIFDVNKIPKDCSLHEMISDEVLNKNNNNTFQLDYVFSNVNFEIIYNYLMLRKLPSYGELHILDLFGISELHSYELATVRENYMRENIYKEEFKDHQINTNNYYALQKTTENYWNKLTINNDKVINEESILFEKANLKKHEWVDIQKELTSLKELMDCLNEGPGKCVIAGGKIFNVLFNQSVKSSDVDIFIYGCNQKEAEEKILKLNNYLSKKVPKNVQLIDELSDNEVPNNNNELSDNEVPNNNNELTDNEVPNNNNELSDNELSDNEIPNLIIRGIDDYRHFDDDSYTIVRTKNTVSITILSPTTQEYQIILRLYKTASEILHGFDVDSCSMAFDGENIWMSQRALFSIINGYNTVNFERLSPSYEIRLTKYALRGMKIYIPEFNKGKVEYEKLSEYHDQVTTIKQGDQIVPKTNGRYDFVRNLKGIDKLIYFEYRLEKYNFNKRSIGSINTISDAYSDYHAYKLAFNKRDTGNIIESLVHYLMNSASNIKYKKYSDQYIPLIERLDEIKFSNSLERDNELTRQIKLNIKKLINETNIQLDLNKQKNIQTNPHFLNVVPFYNDINNKVLDIYHVINNEYVNVNHKRCQIEQFMDSWTNNLAASSFNYLRYTISSYLSSYSDKHEDIMYMLLHIPTSCYEILKVVKEWDFDPNVTFKTTNPGEQMTNTFNKIVYEDNKEWYKGQFYKL